MKPVPSEPSDLVNRLRQQLILAQVRIMELEDERDTLTPRLAETGQLLQAAQSLADRKMDEAAHLEIILAATRSRCEQLGQLQVRFAAELSDVVTKLDQRNEEIRQLKGSLQRLESELQTFKSSRSWRWTAWLRALGGKS